MHLACLNTGVAHSGHKMHCPLCIKRRWHLIRPVTPAQRESQSADDFHMKRVRRYYRWHRYNCNHIDDWQRLHDDGSLDSDRKLLIDMGAARVRTKQQLTSRSGHGAVDGASAGSDGRATDHGHRARPSHSNGGRAAEYYDSDASRLETGRAPEAARVQGGSHSAREGLHEFASSVLPSKLATSRRSSNWSVRPNEAAVSSTSKTDSQAPSSVGSSSTSSDAASAPRQSVVKSALESGLTELSKVASSAIPTSLVSRIPGTNLGASKHSTTPSSASDDGGHNSSATRSKTKIAQQLADKAESTVSQAPSGAPSSSRATISQRVGEKLDSMLPSSKEVAAKVAGKAASSVMENTSHKSDAAGG